MSKLTHNDLLKLGHLLGYKLTEEGLCRGFSCMFAQAILASDKKSFFNRLNFIASYKPNFDALIKDIEKAKKAKPPTDEETNQLLQILAFFEGIELYLVPHNHSDLFAGNITQQNVKTIFSFAKSKELEKTDIITLLDKPYAFNRNTLGSYFNDLAIILGKTDSELPILLGSSNHSISLTYNKINKKWLYVDINNFAREPDNPSYYRELDNQELVDNIFVSLSDEDAEHVVFNTTIFADTNTQNLSSIKDDLEKFDLSYPIKPQHVSMYDWNNAGLLYIACKNGNLTSVQTILKNNKIDINHPTDNKVTPFYIACQNGHLEIVQELLKRANINQATDEGETPLLIACRMGHLAIVQELLKRKDLIINSARSEDKATPFFIACESGHLEIVQELLKQGKININQTISNGATPFLIACQKGHLAIVQELLKQNQINIDKPMDNGASPLYFACQQGHLAVVQELLKHDQININQTMNPGVTPLHIACQQGHLAVVQELLKHDKININQPMGNGVTALHIACQQGHLAIVQELLKHKKINMNQPTNNGVTPHDIACQRGQIELIELLRNSSLIETNTNEMEKNTSVPAACSSLQTKENEENENQNQKTGVLSSADKDLNRDLEPQRYIQKWENWAKEYEKGKQNQQTSALSSKTKEQQSAIIDQSLTTTRPGKDENQNQKTGVLSSPSKDLNRELEIKRYTQKWESFWTKASEKNNQDQQTTVSSSEPKTSPN